MAFLLRMISKQHNIQKESEQAVLNDENKQNTKKTNLILINTLSFYGIASV